MNDLPPDARPVPPPDPDPNPTQAMPAQQSPDPAAPAPTKNRLRDRLWSLRAVIAVALASVIVGGLGGAALANLSQGDDGRLGPGRFQRGGPGGPGMMNRGPGMMNGGPRGRKQFPDRRGMGLGQGLGHGQGQRQWDREQQGQPLTPAPSPKLP